MIKQNKIVVKKKEVSQPPKKTEYSRLIAVDPSLTCSGWALLELNSERLIGTGKVRSLPPKYALAYRLADLQEKLYRLYDALYLGPTDILICEAPTTMRDPKAALKVEQVRCIFETTARTRRIEVPGRINPRTVHSEVLNMRGAQMSRNIIKETARSVASNLYGKDLLAIGLPATNLELKKHQDIVDAILIGHVSVAKLKQAERTQTDIIQCFLESRKRV